MSVKNKCTQGLNNTQSGATDLLQCRKPKPMQQAAHSALNMQCMNSTLVDHPWCKHMPPYCAPLSSLHIIPSAPSSSVVPVSDADAFLPSPPTPHTAGQSVKEVHFTAYTILLHLVVPSACKHYWRSQPPTGCTMEAFWQLLTCEVRNHGQHWSRPPGKIRRLHAKLAGKVDFHSWRNRWPPSYMADYSGCNKENGIAKVCKKCGTKEWSKSDTLTVSREWDHNLYYYCCYVMRHAS